MLMVVRANSRLPSVTTQDVGRDLYHGRQDVVQIVGDRRTLENIAWIFQKVPDMFEIQFKSMSLIVRRAKEQTGPQATTEENAATAVSALELMAIAH